MVAQGAKKFELFLSLLRLHFLWFNQWFTWGPNMRTREAARLLRRLRARDAKWILKPSLSSSLNNGGRSRIPRPREEAKAPCGVVQTHYTRVASSVLILRGCSLYVVIPSPVVHTTNDERWWLWHSLYHHPSDLHLYFLQYQTIRRKQLVVVGRRHSHL